MGNGFGGTGTQDRPAYGGEIQVGYASWIRNVPSLGGIENPTETGDGLWVEGVVGLAEVDGAPVRKRKEWVNGATCDDMSGYQLFDLVLEAADNASKSIHPAMGETQTWDVATAALPGPYTVKNLASKQDWNGTIDLSYVVARRAP